MAEDPLGMPFHTSQNPGPKAKNHIMHLEFASNSEILLLVVYGAAIALSIVARAGDRR